MRSFIASQIIFAVLLLWPAVTPASGSAAAAAADDPVPVVLWVVGDDGLTQRFASALRAEIKKSPEFTEADVASGRPFRLLIPTNVEGYMVHGKMVVHFAVVFMDANSKYLGGTFSGCFESEMSTCAEQVVSNLRSTLADKRGVTAP